MVYRTPGGVRDPDEEVHDLEYAAAVPLASGEWRMFPQATLEAAKRKAAHLANTGSGEAFIVRFYGRCEPAVNFERMDGQA